MAREGAKTWNVRTAMRSDEPFGTIPWLRPLEPWQWCYEELCTKEQAIDRAVFLAQCFGCGEHGIAEAVDMKENKEMRP